jgi:hypothetical protein
MENGTREYLVPFRADLSLGSDSFQRLRQLNSPSIDGSSSST